MEVHLYSAMFNPRTYHIQCTIHVKIADSVDKIPVETETRSGTFVTKTIALQKWKKAQSKVQDMR